MGTAMHVQSLWILLCNRSCIALQLSGRVTGTIVSLASEFSLGIKTKVVKLVCKGLPSDALITQKKVNKIFGDLTMLVYVSQHKMRPLLIAAVSILVSTDTEKWRPSYTLHDTFRIY